MSGETIAPGPRLERRPQPRFALNARARDVLGQLLIELVLFASLATLGMALWARLVEPSSAGSMAPALLIVCVGATVLRLLDLRLSGRSRAPIALAIALLMLFGSLLAAGLPTHYLDPGEWGALREEIRAAVGAIEGTQLPYDGADPWIRLTLILGAPALVALAAAVGFWPGERRGLKRAVALAVLLITYGVGSTLDNPGAEAVWGIVLLVLSVAWLWVPGLGPGRRGLALATAAAAGVLVLPLAARLNGPAWWDYESWSWFGAKRSVTFDWNHSYGPLDWPRDGTTLMTVETDTPLYWKASVLDRFDGYTWQRAAPGDIAAGAERSARAMVPGRDLATAHPKWVTEANFQLRALTSDVVIGAGVPQLISGLDGTLVSGDGTLARVGTPLERGDEYSVVSYVPQPTPDQLRRAPVAHSQIRFGGSTLLTIPSGPPDGSTLPAVSMPMWGTFDPTMDARLRDSPYAGTYSLAREWTAGARTPYDAVRAIESHLRRDYSYTPSVGDHTYPLEAFLFSDRAGYCQQFAGTMGLMLRMIGIPSRVVSGFAPGARDEDSDTYEIHDYDAHSWVEVYFRGIGWVTFDPTPNAAPAESQRLGGDFATSLRGPAPNPPTENRAQPGRTAGSATSTAPITTPADGSAWSSVVLAVLAGLLGLTAVGAAFAWRRRKRLASGEQGDAQIDELRSALASFGWRIGPSTTLLAIEHRATGHSRTPVREYVGALRRSRYAGTAPPPGPTQRRAFRRALSGGGIRRRIKGLFAIPPGGPRLR